MRIFKNESMWDAENQQWIDLYTIDGNLVPEEVYYEQFKFEELVSGEEITEDYMVQDEILEVEQNYMECDCPECIEQKNKMIYLAESVMRMFEEELCPQCVFEMLQDIYDNAYDSGFEDGYEEMKEEMQEFLD